jgi:hypothetical protein
MAAAGKWRPEWTKLLGTLPDKALGAQLGLAYTSVRHQRRKRGIEPCARRKVPCKTCPAMVSRKRGGKDIVCKACRRKHSKAVRSKWRQANRLDIRKYDRRWFVENREKRLRDFAEWERTHPEKRRAIDRRWRKKQAQLAQETLASVPCLDCGVKHTFERRAEVIRRMLPATAKEIREARPCFWGDASDVDGAGRADALPGPEAARGARRRDLLPAGGSEGGGMSYRLDQRDEADVRYWLGDDIRGEVGVHSGSGSLDARSIYKPIENFKPYRHVERDQFGRLTWSGTEDVGLRCGPIVVKPKKPAYVQREEGDLLVTFSERDFFLESLWKQLDPAVNPNINPDTRVAIELCYSGLPVPKGFEDFGDIAPLLYDTKAAPIVQQREASRAKRQLTRLEALMQFGFRMMQKGIEIKERDYDLKTEMETEADARLSMACREYTRVADAAYKAKKEATLA